MTSFALVDDLLVASDALSGRTWKHVPMPDGFDSTKRN